MNCAQAGIELIKKFEGCKLTAYQDGGGVFTIGYGHTAGVHSGQAITQGQAEQFFADDLAHTVKGVNAALGHIQARQAHFDAFTAFSFDLGAGDGGFGGSTLLKKYLAGQDCSSEFLRWSFDNGKLVPGLVIRRMAERQLFRGKSWIDLM